MKEFQKNCDECTFDKSNAPQIFLLATTFPPRFSDLTPSLRLNRSTSGCFEFCSTKGPISSKKYLYYFNCPKKPTSAIGLFKLLASERGSQFMFQPFGTFNLSAMQVCNPPEICQAHNQYPPHSRAPLEKPLV